tara:strand:- start:28363 stop:28551 length:189 start_codon:yes stop_codon:yes gene_type:complete
MKQETNKESLHLAAGANDLDAVSNLLKDGADIDAIDRRGLKATHVGPRRISASNDPRHTLNL